MKNDIESILVSENEIDERVSELAEQITKDYEGKNLFVIGVLKGSFIFMADLVRKIQLPCQIDFMAVSSYGGNTKTTGAVKITKDLNADIEGKDVLIVEDILDSGRTLNYLINYFRNRHPASVRICTLLDKPERREVPLTADYSGFDIPNRFVVGYGLDYDERYRNLPYIGVLKPEVYMDK